MSGLDVKVAAKRYGKGPLVIEDLKLVIPGGEVAALLGPSGTGKTTLLGILAGLDRDYDGTIRLHGESLREVKPRIGMVFQEPRLLPWLTVRDNIALVLRDADAERHWIDELLEAVGLASRADAWPGQLSSGMQRRVALARAFAVRPDLLLLDEPFVSLDVPTARRLRTLLQRLWQARRPTVVLVSHDMEDALALADRIFFLSDAPAKVVLEQPLPGARTPASQDRRRHIAEQLLLAHPTLLAGRLNGPLRAIGGSATR